MKKNVTLINVFLLLFVLLTGSPAYSQAHWTVVTTNDFTKFPTGFTNSNGWSNQTYGANGSNTDKCGYAKVPEVGNYLGIKAKLSKNKFYRFSYKMKKSEDGHLLVRLAYGVSKADFKGASDYILLPKIAASMTMDNYISSVIQVPAEGDYLLAVEVVETTTQDAKFRIDDFKLESMDIPATPVLNANPVSVDMRKIQIMESKTCQFQIQGYNLTGDLDAIQSGTAFTTSIMNNVITKDAVLAEGGYTFDVTFNPTTVASYVETITISGGGLATPVVINLTGEGAQMVAATIADLRVMDADNATEYTFGGTAVVTLASKDRNVKYIQDGTGAILIDDNSGLIKGTYTTGDEISTVKGKLNTSNGMLQFVVTTDATKGATGVEVTPVEIKIEDLTVADQAKLIKIKAVQLVSKGLLFAKGTNVTIENSTVVIRPHYSDLLGLIGKPVPTANLQDVTGVVLANNDAAQIIPRTIADIVDADLVRLMGQHTDGVDVYAGNGVIYVNASSGQAIDIFNTIGQKLQSVVAVEGLNTINYNAAGIIIVKVGVTAVKVQM